MSGRYLFEFFRHHCGRTISIHGEKCLCEMRGFMEKTTPAMRSLRRLLRRAKAHGHEPGYVKHENGIAIALFAGRHIRIRDDGSFVQDMMARWVGDERKTDPHCHGAFLARFDTNELNWAGECRRRGWRVEARRALNSLARNRKATHHA